MSNLFNKLKKIHKRVFKGFEYITDKEQYSNIEKWVIPENPDKVKGDCEDFGLAIRTLLIEESIPCRLVFCYDETGAGHLVVSVDGWILDNRQTKVVTRDRLEKRGYIFIKQSGVELKDVWEFI